MHSCTAFHHGNAEKNWADASQIAILMRGNLVKFGMEERACGIGIARLIYRLIGKFHIHFRCKVCHIVNY